MTIAYFCLSGLSLLPSSAISSNSENQSALDVLIKDNQREGFKDWIYNLQDIGGGFRGGNSMDFEERLPQKFDILILFCYCTDHFDSSIPNLVPLSLTEEEEFELLMSFEEPDSPILSTKLIPPSSLAPANLIQTYTALLCLGILSCSLERLNIAALIRFVAKCQNDDGS